MNLPIQYNLVKGLQVAPLELYSFPVSIYYKQIAPTEQNRASARLPVCKTKITLDLKVPEERPVTYVNFFVDFSVINTILLQHLRCNWI